MKANQHHTELEKIESYLNNSLSESEKNEIEKDSFLMMAIEGYAENKDSIQSYKKLEHKFHNNIHLYWGLGLSTLFIGIAVFFINSTTPSSTESQPVSTTKTSVIPSDDQNIATYNTPNFSTKKTTHFTPKPITTTPTISIEKPTKQHQEKKETPQNSIESTIPTPSKTEEQPQQSKRTTSDDSVFRAENPINFFANLHKKEKAKKDSIKLTKEREFEKYRHPIQAPDPVDFSVYSISTQKYLMSTYHKGIQQQNRTSARGQAKAHKFSKYVDEKNYDKAWKMIQKQTQFNVGANKNLIQWIQVIKFVENENYKQALQLVNTLPILPPVLNNLKIHLKKDLEEELKS